MLVEVAGTSGVGKSTVSKYLCQKDPSFHLIHTYTTRPPRDSEKEKTSIEDKEFLMLQSNDSFFSVDKFYGYMYGITHTEVEKAINSQDQFYLLDRPIFKWETFEIFSPLKVILLPESLDSLVERIEKCGRSERIPAIISEFKLHYQRFYKEQNIDSRTCVVVNNDYNIEETAAIISSFVSNQLKSSFNSDSNTARSKKCRLG